MKKFDMPVIPGEEKIAEFVRRLSANDLVERMTSRERGRILDRDPVSADCVIMEFFSRLVTAEIPEARAAIHYAAYSSYDLPDFRQAILRRRAERKEAYLASQEEDDDCGGMDSEEIPTTDDDSHWVEWCKRIDEEFQKGQEEFWAEKSAQGLVTVTDDPCFIRREWGAVTRTED